MINSLVFSVIVPTYHRNDLLSKCLDCLGADIQSISSEQYEVIVTDDGLETTALNMIKENYPWVKWYAGPHKGPAANRNNGSKYARGEWLVFTDDDCLPDPQWLLAYYDGIKNNPDCKVLEGRTYVNRPRRSLAEVAPANETGGYLWSCNFAIGKKLFEELDGFDQRFPYAAMEDIDLRFRLAQKKRHFVFLKNASLLHHWDKHGGWKKLKQHQFSTFIYLSIHPEEISNINSIYYLKLALYGFLKNILPGLFKYKGRGLLSSCIEMLSYLQMSVLLFPKYIRYKVG